MLETMEQLQTYLDNIKKIVLNQAERIKELEAEIVKLRNDYVNVADDLNYHTAIFDGSWPTSVEILERVLAKVKAQQGE